MYSFSIEAETWKLSVVKHYHLDIVSGGGVSLLEEDGVSQEKGIHPCVEGTYRHGT